MRWLIAFVLAAGCYQRAAELDCTVACGPADECPDGTHCSNGLCGAGTCGPFEDGGDSDGSDAFTTCTFYGHAGFRPCVQSVGGAVVLASGSQLPGPYTCDLQAQSRGGAAVCVLAFESIEVTGQVTVGGAAPIALIGRDFIQVDAGGELDAGSHSGLSVGAGANPSSCARGTIDGHSGDGGGGGAGGTFASTGGTGGNGASGGVGGTPALPSSGPYPVRGGCPGGTGGGGNATGPPGGDGGGAIALFSNGRIEIDGLIDASGAGALLATADAGGAGGGAGGYIGIDGDPMMYIFAGTLWADGGGGSSGSDPTLAGTAGQDPQATAGSAPIPGAGGIALDVKAGAGGTGGSRQNAAGGGGPTVSIGASAGGGGGGYGVIAIYDFSSGNPPLTIDPFPTAP